MDDPNAVEIYFVWVGSGELLDAVRQFISDVDVKSRARLIGWRTDVDQLLAGADIFLLTSEYESFGYVTCEAMAQGLPVVATNVSGSIDIIEHDVTGFLAPVGDTDAIARHVLRLAADPDLRNRMGKAGNRRVREAFNVEKMVSEVESLYTRLLARRNRKRSDGRGAVEETYRTSS